MLKDANRKEFFSSNIESSDAFPHLYSKANLVILYADHTHEEESGYGWGWTIEQASEHILNPLIVPVGMMLLIVSIGAICGGIGFVIVNLKKGDSR